MKKLFAIMAILLLASCAGMVPKDVEMTAADQKLTALTPLGEAPASGDLTYLVDITGNTSHSITVDNLMSYASNYRSGGTDVAVTDGGTGASTAAAAATALGVGTTDSPQFAGVNVGAATDTTIARAAAGVISVEGGGGLAATTPMTGDADDFDNNFTGAYLYGGTYVCNAAGTVILPAVAAGMSFSIVTLGDVAVVIDPNASDSMLTDGVQGADGENITNGSSAGDVAVVQYYSSAGWLVTTNGWTPE